MARPGVLALLPLLLVACGGGAADDDDDTPDAGATSGWQAREPVLGGAVQETACVELRGRIYVIGGFKGLTVTPQVVVYDPATDSWAEAAPLPVGVHHANAAVVGDRIYLVGGMLFESFSFVPIGNVWAYDPDADEWTERMAMPNGAERGSAAVGVIDGIIYLAGGLTTPGPVDLVSAYDPEADEWTHPLQPLPVARDHGGGAAVGGTLYTVGGRQGDITAFDGRTFAYDPVGDAWTERAPMPTPRGGIGVGVVDGRILAVGGEGNPDVASGVFPDTESYDPVADEWTALAPMTSPRHGMGAVGYDGALYVPGGANVQAFGAVDTHEIFIP
jgi:N-acetylneuraminic acid mutarotase